MEVDFFARFNLHHNVCSVPISEEMLQNFLQQQEADLRTMLSEVDAIQKQRAERLKQRYGSQLDGLRGKKVLFLGDSITSDNLGYRRAVTETAELVGVDGSVSGGTSSTLIQMVKRQIEKEKPDLISLMIGSNDSVSVEREDFHQVGISEYERNVSAILRWAKQQDAKILLFEIPPVVEERFAKNFSGQSKLQSNLNIERYNDVLKRLARQYEIEVVSNGWLSESKDFFEPDGIHLSILGQKRFAENWLAVAIENIKKGE